MSGEEVMAVDGRLESVLLARHREFLAFLARRLGSRSDAEEVLQGAYARALERGVPDEDTYAYVVRAVDLEDRPLAEVAAGGGITVNDATVRLHRARPALRSSPCGPAAPARCTAASSATAGPGPGGLVCKGSEGAALAWAWRRPCTPTPPVTTRSPTPRVTTSGR